MAGIKIENIDAQGEPDGTLNTSGYIDVAKKIFIDAPVFEELAEYSNSELIDFLMDFNSNQRVVTIEDGKKLKPRNARVTAHYDDTERTRRGKPRVTLNLPKDNPDRNLAYLQPFIDALAGLATATEKRRFLMGMLVLTKCR